MSIMKLYVITDPCFLLDEEERRIYSQAALSYARGPEESLSSCDALLSGLLGTEARAEKTGCGKWLNMLRCVHGPNNIHWIDHFRSESGMVSVSRFTPETDALLHRKKIPEGDYVLFEAENPAIEISRKDPSWTVIRITDGRSVYASLPDAVTAGRMGLMPEFLPDDEKRMIYGDIL